MASRLDPIALFRSVAGRLVVAMFIALAFGAGLQIWQSHAWDRANIKQAELAGIRGIAAATAANISGDAHEAAAHASPSKDQFTTWAAAPDGARELHQLLALVVTQTRLDTPIYTLRVRDDSFDAVRTQQNKVHKDAMEFIATSAEAPYWRHLYDYRPEMGPALWGGTPAITGIYESGNQAWISAYAPVFDSDGQVVAILEVDEHYEDILTAQDSRLRSHSLFFAGVGASVFLMVLLIMRRLATGFDLIQASANRLGDGDFVTPADAGSYFEVEFLAKALERARDSLAQREASMRGASAQIAQQRDLALRGITDASFKRRKALKDAKDVVRAALQVGKGSPVAVRLADISYRSASVHAKATLDLPPGAPVRLRIGSTTSGRNLVVQSTVVKRVALSEQVYEYDLRMDLEATHISFPQPVHRIMNSRAAMRVKPTAPGQVAGAILIEGRRLPVQVMDVSVTGAGVRLNTPTEIVAQWGTRLVLELTFAERSEPVIFDVDVARIWRHQDDTTRMGLDLYDAKEGGFARRQQALADFVRTRSREMTATTERGLE